MRLRARWAVAAKAAWGTRAAGAGIAGAGLRRMRRWSTPWPWRLDPPPKRRRAGKAGDDDDLEYIVANPNDVWSNVNDSGCTLRRLRPH